MHGVGHAQLRSVGNVNAFHHGSWRSLAVDGGRVSGFRVFLFTPGMLVIGGEFHADFS